MSTTTVITQHTLEDLARRVNRLIMERPEQINPTMESGDATCAYHLADTDQRCLIGQALFEMTGLNVPDVYEGIGIDELLDKPGFCDWFGLPYNARWNHPVLHDSLSTAQSTADCGQAWGAIPPINVKSV